MPKHIELLTKSLAAERLGVSVRRLMEWSMDDKFTRHRAYDPATKREAVMFDAAEVDAWKAANTPAPVRPRLPRGDDFAALDEDPMAFDWNASMAGVGRLWLTLAEAAEYTGLPASHLLAAIESGELAARDVGVRPGGHWRVRRLDLDAIAGKRAR